uniref:ATP synthase complex subunit 8 n=1 Tax=Micrambe villosus TaxID=1588241 RepID=A0A343C3A4_9CUCU|nr:ATP synthase F0 subunit 8 [Micrambe villosus]
MPQMAPLSWLLLFIFFSMIFMLYNLSNFFMFLYSVKESNKSKINIKTNWQW